MIKIARLLAILIAAPTIAQGCALTLNSGTFKVTPYYSYYNTKQIWDRGGKRQPNYNRFTKNEAGLCIEYGISACNTLWIRSAYDSISEKLDGNSYGFTDFETGIRRQIYSNGQSSLATALTAIIPASYGYKPGIRYGEWGVQGTIIARRSFSFGKSAYYLFNSFGYRWYRGFPSDQLRHRASLMVPIVGGASIRLGSSLDFGLFNGKSRLDQSLVWLNPNYRLWQAEASLQVPITDRFCLAIGYFYHLWGQNVGTGGSFVSSMTATF